MTVCIYMIVTISWMGEWLNQSIGISRTWLYLEGEWRNESMHIYIYMIVTITWMGEWLNESIGISRTWLYLEGEWRNESMHIYIHDRDNNVKGRMTKWEYAYKLYAYIMIVTAWNLNHRFPSWNLNRYVLREGVPLMPRDAVSRTANVERTARR